jgi:hypothetical protein
MPTGIETLGDALPQEIERNRRLLKAYEEIGPAGLFAHTLISQEIRAAEKAITDGDVVAMIRAYNALKDNSE